jgi:hypothetical protein
MPRVPNGDPTDDISAQLDAEQAKFDSLPPPQPADPLELQAAAVVGAVKDNPTALLEAIVNLLRQPPQGARARGFVNVEGEPIANVGAMPPGTCVFPADGRGAPYKVPKTQAFYDDPERFDRVPFTNYDEGLARDGVTIDGGHWACPLEEEVSLPRPAYEGAMNSIRHTRATYNGDVLRRPWRYGDTRSTPFMGTIKAGAMREGEGGTVEEETEARAS